MADDFDSFMAAQPQDVRDAVERRFRELRAEYAAPPPRLVPDRPSEFDGFSAANVVRMLDEWAADQREREAWNDGDKSTYTFRAGLLQTAANRLRDAAAPPADAPAERGEWVLVQRDEVRRVIHELNTYSPIADEYKGAHIHKVWARELSALLAAAPAAPATDVAIDYGVIALFAEHHKFDYNKVCAFVREATTPRVTGGREAITGYVNGYLHGAQCVEFKADAPLPSWLTASPGLRVTLALQDANGGAPNG